jgi:hypothetical protein
MTMGGSSRLNVARVDLAGVEAPSSIMKRNCELRMQNVTRVCSLFELTAETAG